MPSKRKPPMTDHDSLQGAGNPHSPAPLSSADRIAELRDELFGIKTWLEYWLGTKCESRHSRDSNGHINNTWGVVPIPDWDVKQKLQAIDMALANTKETPIE